MKSQRRNYRRAWRRACERVQRLRIVPLSPLEVERVCDWVMRREGHGLALWLRNSERANHRDVVPALIERSYARRNSEPKAALRYAEAAVEVAGSLRLGSAYAVVEADLRAMAWTSLANILRILGRYDDAAALWPRAEEVAESGSLDPLLQADMLARRANLLCDIKQYEEAGALLVEAVELNDRCNEPHLAAKARVLASHISYLADQPADGIEPLDRASKDLDYDAEPEVGFALVHNAILCLEASGRDKEALAGSHAARVVYDEIAPPLLQLRAGWLRGRMYLHQRAPKLAEIELEAARQGFLRLELPVDACFVTLELALAYARQNDWLKIMRLAGEMYPLFSSQKLPTEAAALLITFGDAAKRCRAQLEDITRWVAELAPLRRAYERGGSPSPASSPAD